MIFAKSLIVVSGVAECGYPWQFSLITASLVAVFFALFADFYLRAYSKSRVKAVGSKTNGAITNGTREKAL